MLELDDIQHILLTRAPAVTGRYEFLSFRSGAGGRAWLSAIKGTVHSAASMRASVESDKRWVTVAFTWNGLRALGLDEASLASFPEEFKQGMPARAQMLGDTGANAPENWVGELASPDLHAIAILFARDEAERTRCSASTTSWWRRAKAWRSCPCLISMPIRHSTTRTTISGIATGSRSRSSKEAAKSRRRAQARH
jgi:hypothetical protein